MKRKLSFKKIALLSIFVLIFGVSGAHASQITVNYLYDFGEGEFSGAYMFTNEEPGNEQGLFSPPNNNYYANFLAVVNTWLLSNAGGYQIDNFVEVEKINVVGDSFEVGSTLTATGGNMLNGTWSSTVPVQFYTVKAGSDFAIYWLGVDGAMGDYWSTRHIKDGNKGISHISTWNATAKVPEPSTLLLFGAGIAGLALYRRKKS